MYLLRCDSSLCVEVVETLKPRVPNDIQNMLFDLYV